MYLHSDITQSLLNELKDVQYVSEYNVLYIFNQDYSNVKCKDINTKLGTNVVCHKKLTTTIDQQVLERKLFYKYLLH